ncbi:MAG: hypothetical protein AB1758_16200, partial [Candidatus Eremiobacterota bacterium]
YRLGRLRGRSESSSSDTWTVPTMRIRDSTVSGSGDMVLLCNVKGENGTITSEKNLVLAAASVELKKEQNDRNSGGGKATSAIEQRLSLYVKEDLTVSTYSNEFGLAAFGPFNLDGLIYVWGDARLYAANPDSAPRNFGDNGQDKYNKISIQGALVAYGSDPGSSSPGSSGKGNVSLYAQGVSLTYDPSKLVSPVSQPEAGEGVEFLTRLSYGFVK